MNTKTWTEIKDSVYGVKGTERREILNEHEGILATKALIEKVWRSLG